METRRIDLLQWLQIDMVLNIFSRLDDPSDLIRASAVSRSWRHFVIGYGLLKQFCLRLFPQLSSIAYITESSFSTGVGSSNSVERGALEREHRAYAYLARVLTAFSPRHCMAQAVSASSTDRYPEESILNTLDPRDRLVSRGSYWSSKGQSDPLAPETLIYRLIANLCVITEISVQPFQAFFEPGIPIYSAKYVRFRMGHPISPKDIANDLKDLPLQLPADDKFIWTYTSQKFPMAQENRLQKFKLPEPVLCMGGFLQIELMGRVQKEAVDGLFYICVSHVNTLGQPLFPVFDAEILDPSGKFLLKYFPEARNLPPLAPHPQLLHHFLRGDLREMEELMAMFHGNVPNLEPYELEEEDVDDDSDDDDDDGGDENDVNDENDFNLIV